MHRTLVRQMGKDGWLGIGWPKEFGGQGRPASDQFIFFDEVQRARAPFPFVTLNTVGPTIMRLRHRGAEELLPLRHPGRRDQLRHRLHRARRPAPTWPRCAPGPCSTATSRSSTATRSSPAAPTRPTTSGWPPAPTPTPPSTRASPSSWCRPPSPGFSCTPIVTVGNVVTTATYYDNVRVPRTALVGELNEGWRLITTQLNHERVGLGAHERAFRTRGSGRRRPQWADRRRDVADVDWVQADLARTYALLEAHEAAQLADGGCRGRRHAGPGRLLGGQGVRHRDAPSRSYRRLLGIVGSAGYLHPDSPGRRSGASSSAPAARPRSTPSAAGSTRSSARSWPWPVWA